MNTPLFIGFGEGLTDLITLGAGRFKAVPGGAGLNVARGVAALGLPAVWAGCLSQDSFGDALYQCAESSAPDLRFIRRFAAPPLLPWWTA